MRKLKLKKNIKYLVSFILTIIFVFSFNETTSRYLGQLESNNEIIAKPILNLNKTSTTTNIDNMLPGEEREFTFSVTNKDGDNLNEVLLSYNFEINAGSNIPLTFEVYRGDTKLNLINNETSEEEMPYGEEVTRDYKLKIIWDASNNDVKYAGQTVTLTVTMNAIQVLPSNTGV